MEDFVRVEKSLPNINYQPQQSNQVGPARPPPMLLQEQDSDTDSEDVLKNDPIYQRSKEDTEQQFNNKRKLEDTKDEDDGTTLSSIGIPISHHVILKGSERLVTSIAVDKAANRFITSSYDYNIRLYDFLGMNKSMNAFRIVEPLEGQPVKKVSFNKDGTRILAILSGKQAKLLDREGRLGNITIKGDMYITDMSKTLGHCQELNDGQFSPTEEPLFATCAQDCTIRLWDVNKRLHGLEQHMSHLHVIKTSDVKGAKTIPTTLQYTSDGKLIFAGCADGSIQGFSTTSNFHRSQFAARNCHNPKNDITCVQFFGDNQKLISRSLDNAVKIWDLRQFKKPIEAIYNQSSSLPGARACISANQRYIVVPTYEHQKKSANLFFYSADTFEQRAKLYIGDQNVTDIQWNSRLNQILLATGTSIEIFFDPKLSQNGALNCIQKQVRKATYEDQWTASGKVFTPHALPMFHDCPDWLKKERQELEQKKNDPSTYGPGQQGNPGIPASTAQLLMKMTFQKTLTREDAHEALLKLNKKATDNPQFVDNAYKKTAPTRIYYDNAPVVEEQQFLSQILKICKGCGLKLCTCSKRVQFEDKKLFEDRSLFEDEFKKK